MKRKKEPILPSGKPLCEAGKPEFDLTEAMASMSLDKEAGIIRNVQVAKRESKNRRVYEDSALRDIATIADGVSIFLNHAAESEIQDRDGIRDVKDLGGVLRNTKFSEGRVVGDIYVAPDLRDKFSWIAEAKPKGVGLSLVSPYGQYEMQEGMNGAADRVLRIHALESVDIVSRAGMADNLFEAETTKERDAMEIKTVADLREHYGALLAEALKPVETERDELKARVAKAEAREATREALIKSLGESEITKPLAQSIGLVDAWAAVEDEPKRKVLIEVYTDSVKAAKLTETGTVVSLTESDEAAKSAKEKADKAFAAYGL